MAAKILLQLLHNTHHAKSKYSLQSYLQSVAIGDDVNPKPAYYYTGLNGIRPAMLSEATRSAKRVAVQFVHDSESCLCTIRRDEQSSVMKEIRLSTIDYYLDK